jgi:mannose-6-phosphate isomerase-like protein (cupin superfamily)
MANRRRERNGNGHSTVRTGQRRRLGGVVFGHLVIMKATGEQTGGAFGLIDNFMPGGFASPYHMHCNEDESFYVVEGEMTFYVGEQRLKAGAGAFDYGFIQLL